MKILICGKGQPYQANIKMLLMEGWEFQTWDLRSQEQMPKADLLVCIGYPFTIKKETIARFPQGVVNLHTSLLPKYRGRHPVVWAMINGESEIGVTAHFIQDETIDTGNIIWRDYMGLNCNMTYQEVMNKLTEMGCGVLSTALMAIRVGIQIGDPQIEAEASYLPRRIPEDSRIDWTRGKKKICCFVNALSDPMPHAFFEKDGHLISFKQAAYCATKDELYLQWEDGKWTRFSEDFLNSL